MHASQQEDFPTTEVSISVITSLECQQQKIEFAFKEHTTAGEVEHEAKRENLGKLAAQLDAHVTIEKEFLYPLGRIDNREHTPQANLVHPLGNGVIEKVSEVDHKNVISEANITVSNDLVDHWVNIEEKTYFPELKRAFEKSQLLSLGKSMKEEFELLIQNVVRDKAGEQEHLFISH